LTTGLDGWVRSVRDHRGLHVVAPSASMFLSLADIRRCSLRDRRWSGRRRAQPRSVCWQCAQRNASTRRQGVAREDLYRVLGATRDSSPAEIRRAFLEQSQRWHPDRNPGDERASERFEAVKTAYQVLRDATLRAAYDEAGFAGLDAVISVESRHERMKDALKEVQQLERDNASTEELAFWGLDGSNLALLEGAEPVVPSDGGASSAVDQPTDARPRSVAEAIANLNHPDEGYRYYAVWWLSRFRVREAADALVAVLRHSTDRTALGGYPLRRRAALALGNLGALEALTFLQEALGNDEDWHLRHRAAEAIAKILMQQPSYMPNSQLTEALLSRLETFQSEAHNETESVTLPPGFDLSTLDEAKRARLLEIFAKRRADEARARRSTQTPTLGVDLQSAMMQEPYEWLLKALGYVAGRMRSDPAVWARYEDRFVSAMRPLTKHPVPLVQYAAHKAMYQATGKVEHLHALHGALEFGAEHHFSQRVLVRDLGELGQLESASAIANCAMVENSFKVFAIRQIIQRCNLQLTHSALDPLFHLLDDLL